jgi:hypothetical protein
MVPPSKGNLHANMTDFNMNRDGSTDLSSIKIRQQSAIRGDEEDYTDEYDDDAEEEFEGDSYGREMARSRAAAEALEAALLERLQFKQVSVGEGFSCGITLNQTPSPSPASAPSPSPTPSPANAVSGDRDRNGTSSKSGPVARDGDLVCWGARKGHANMPHYIPGPFKQVSVGALGVCALYSEHASVNVSASASSTATIATATGRPHTMQCWGFVTNLVSSNATTTAWDQVAVGPLSVCAVTMLSELECWGTGLHDIERRPMDLDIA